MERILEKRYCYNEHRQVSVSIKGDKVVRHISPPHIIEVVKQLRPRCPVCGGPVSEVLTSIILRRRKKLG